MDNNPNPEPQNNPNTEPAPQQPPQSSPEAIPAPVSPLTNAVDIAPQPQPQAPTAPQPAGGKSKLKLIVSIVVGLIVLVAIGIGAFLLLKPQTPEDMYYSALRDNLTLPSDHKIAIGLKTKSNTTTIDATIVGSPDASSTISKMNIKTSSDTPYGKVDMDFDMVTAEKKDSTKVYTKYNSMTSSDDMLNSMLEGSFSKDWSYTVSDTDSESETTNSAPLVVGLFAPLAAMDKKDADVYISEAKKVQVFKIGKEAINSTFKDQKVKELNVVIDKDAYGKFISNVNDILSKDGKKKLGMDKDGIDQIFGDNSELTANVYVDDGRITGIEMSANLQKIGGNDSTDTEKTALTVSFDYDTKTTVKEPENAKLETSSDGIDDESEF